MKRMTEKYDHGKGSVTTHEFTAMSIEVGRPHVTVSNLVRQERDDRERRITGGWSLTGDSSHESQSSRDHSPDTRKITTHEKRNA